MSLEKELLDFETPVTLSAYEKFLNSLEAIPNYLKTLGIGFFSLLIAFIIYYKAGSFQNGNSFSEISIVTGGLFILLLAAGFLLHIFLVIGSAIVDTITTYNPKIEILGALSITLVLSVFSMITTCILAIFIP